MKRSQALTLSALVLGQASAQSGTIIVNNPSNTNVVTSYYSICPTATSTTVTLSTTTTLCPGPSCNGGTTTVMYAPMPVTTVGSDGKTTVYEDVHYTAACPCDGGVCNAVYTMTRPCPCTAAYAPSTVPAGFTTSAMACNACAQNGGPSTVIVTTPIANGPYASQTPVMGAPYNGASASAGSSAYASAGPNGAVANSGSNAAANAGNGNGNGNAAANSNSNANANTNNGNSGASAGSNANAQTNGGSNPAPVAVSNSTTSTNIVPPIPQWTGSANRVVYAFSAVAAGIVGCMALLL